MDIRRAMTNNLYKEYKAYIKIYEDEYRKVFASKNPIQAQIWELKEEIVYKLEYLKDLQIKFPHNKTNINNHPLFTQIENRRKIIKELMIKKWANNKH
jgi:hypothetical protein